MAAVEWPRDQPPRPYFNSRVAPITRRVGISWRQASLAKMCIRDSFRVVRADGADHVRGLQEVADVLLLDGFDDAGIPDALCSADFYADCHRALRDDGILVINFHVNHPLHHEYLDRVRAAFGSAMFEVVDDLSLIHICRNSNTRASTSSAMANRRASTS